MIYITIPIEPKPQSRPRFRRNGMPYELKEMKEYRNEVTRQCKLQLKDCFEMLSDMPIKAIVTFYITPPKYISKVAKNEQALDNEVLRVYRKPDIDNYVKAIFDSMSGVVFKDDGMIASMVVEKFYSNNPRTEILILEGNEIDDY